MRLKSRLPSLRRPASLMLGAGLGMAALAAAGELSYRTHWLGHTGSEAPAPPRAQGFAVATDGTCVVSSGPGTTAPTVALYREGRLVGRAAAIPGGTHTFTGAVAVSEKYIFAAITIGPAPASAGPAADRNNVAGPPDGRAWHGLWRFTRDGRHAPAPAGRAAEKAFLLVHDSPAQPGLDVSASPAIAGVWIHEGTVFVSDAAAGRVRAFDESTLEPTRGGFPADQPSGLCVLGANLQVIERGAVVSAFSLDGKRTGQVLDEGDDLLPGAVAPTPEGRLMVSDLGASQQVHFFNMSGVPTRVRTLGEETGMYGPPVPGEAGPRRLAGITGVGADASGELYVSMSPPPGGFVLRRFAPDRKTLRWELAAPTLNHGADADPHSDGLDIHSTEGRHALDLGKPPGQSWRWVALSINPFRYTHDARIVPAADAGTTTFREIEGHNLLCVRSSDGSLLSVYRLQGQTAVPALVIHTGGAQGPPLFNPPGRPKDGPWIWRDANGDGQFAPAEFAAAPSLTHSRFQTTPIDARGGLWLTTHSETQPQTHRLCQLPCQGVDDLGIPIYHTEPSATACLQATSPPAARHFLHDSYYDPATDTLYQVASVDSNSSGGSFAVTASDDWSNPRESDGTPGTQRWTFSLPESFQANAAPSLSVAASLVFILNTETLEIDVLQAATGTPLGRITPPAAFKTAPTGLPSPALRAHRRRDGSYLVLVQDPGTPRVLVHHLDDPLDPAPGK